MEGPHPTLWQRKVIWSALTALALAAIGALAVYLIYLVGNVARFLQPILIPFAVAGVLAYLLDPAVSWIERRGVERSRAILLVFFVAVVGFAGICFWVAPAITSQSVEFARRVPSYYARVQARAAGFVEGLHRNFGIRLFPDLEGKPSQDLDDRIPVLPAIPVVTPSPAPGPALPMPSPTAVPSGLKRPIEFFEGLGPRAEPSPSEPRREISLESFLSGSWLKDALPAMVSNTWEFVRRSVGGFLGIFGFLLSLVIVPLYLFYFLANSVEIAKSWPDYLPIRASAFKDEVVSSLQEINSYLIAFFRGQLLVAMINGFLTGIGLTLMGLNFGLLIGLMIMVLNLIPYLGIILCWFPAVVIAGVQYGDWMHPLIVTAIFVGVQQIDGWYVTPRIVGNSVGLHPMTVIVSVLAWSLLLGGLLGAILAVPLTATLKVLLKRYVWQNRFAPATASAAGPDLPEAPPPAPEK